MDEVIATSTPSPTDGYRCAEFETVPIGGGKAFLLSRSGFASSLIPSGLVGFLSSCRAFEAPSRIAGRLASEVAMPLPVAQAIVQDWTKSGLLVSASRLGQDLRSRIAAAAAAEAKQGQIGCIGFVTCGRPESLERALRSYVASSARHGRSVRVVVVDDESSPERRVECRRRLAHCSRELETPIEYAGLEEKSRFIARLSQVADVAPDIVRFALHGSDEYSAVRTGGNRNALLLSTLGEAIFSADDDTVARAAFPPELLTGLALCSEQAGEEYWFFADRAAALAATSEAHVDFLAAHDALLGRSIASLIGDLPGVDELDLTDANGRMLRSLAPSSFVAVTLGGIVGDSGVGVPQWFTLDGPSFERLVQSESSYRGAFASREMLRCARRAVITPTPAGMGTAMGLDNRRRLPPFFPLGRNQDGLFMAVLRATNPDAQLAHVPLALLHDPVGIRRYSTSADSLGGLRRMSSVVALACHSWRPSPWNRDPDRRLRDLGTHLIELGTLPVQDFEHVLWLQALHEESATIAYLEKRLEVVHLAHGAWSNDVTAYIRALRSGLMDRTCILPTDVGDGAPPAILGGSQALIRRYGHLLSNWCAIVDAARKLRDEGEALSAPLQ